MLYPATGVSSGVHVRSAVCALSAAPVPLTDWSMGEAAALLTNAICAVAAPLACGVKLIVNGTLWPAGRVKGSESPPTVNPALVLDTELTTTLPPTALRLAVSELLLPTVTLPKSTIAGVIVRLPLWLVVWPSPDKGMDNGPKLPLKKIRRLSPSKPAALGLNVTWKVMLSDGAKSIGVLRPEKVKPLPVACAQKILTEDPPLLVRTSDNVLLEPS